MLKSAPPSPLAQSVWPASNAAARSLKERVHGVLEESSGGTPIHRLVNLGIVGLIVVNVVASIIETVPGTTLRYGSIFAVIESVSVAVFVVEYFSRMWVASCDDAYKGFGGRLKFMLRPVMIVDALATFPSLLLPALDLCSLRLLRIFRLLRTLKLVRYSRSLRVLGRVLSSRRDQLALCLSFVGVLLILSSSLLYFAENQAQPEAFSSIPATMWWAICTLTTVGYGDIYPVTIIGKLLASVLAVLGVGLFALPAGILASGFSEEMDPSRSTFSCPECGHRSGGECDD